jgi:acyl dehydratase
MPNPFTSRVEDDGRRLWALRSHRRTITETDIVNFVNLVGLHEPPFIDMESLQSLPESHARRFAPAPLRISIGMGLVATHVGPLVEAIASAESMGPFHGMVGIEATVKRPAYPGDTLAVELEGRVDRKTSRGGTLIDLEHVLANQRGEVVVVFTEKLLFDPPAQPG